MRSHLRTRLIFSHLLVVVVAMGMLGALLLSLMERYFLQAMADSLSAQAGVTVQALALGTGPQEGAQNAAANTLQQQAGNLSLLSQNVPVGDLLWANRDALPDAALELSARLNTRIRIVDASGRVMVDSRQEQQGQDLRGDPLVARALGGEPARCTDSAGLWQPQAMHLAAPVRAEGRVVGAVYLSQPLDDAAAVLRDLRWMWLLATGIAVALAAGISLGLSGAIARPIRRLTEAAQSVAGGHLNEQVPVRSRDEIGRLGQAFNEMTARLRAARQVQIDFVANVSHELRTPLTSIKGMLETLRAGALDDPEVRDRFLDTTERETDRLIRLVNDLLLLSRIDSEALPLHLQTVDLVERAEAVKQRLMPQAEAHRIALRVEAAEDTPPARADPDRVEQVLTNLLDNAIQYSHPGGTVVVSIAADAGQVQVQVRDQGIGIPAADLARIGERFYRADRARSRAEGGSGLGLAIARALVQAQGGQLHIASEEGKGTTVSFTLPTA